MRYLFIAAPFVLLTVVIWGLGITGIAARRTQLSILWSKHFAQSRRERNFIASFAFFITFGILRWITTTIHAESSSFFHDVRSGRGLHIHHLVWGILGLLLGLRPLNVVSFVVELPACLSTREPPVDGDLITVHSPVPGPGFPPQVAERGDSSLAQTLPGEQADLNLGLIQPTAVFRRVMDGR